VSSETAVLTPGVISLDLKRETSEIQGASVAACSGTVGRDFSSDGCKAIGVIGGSFFGSDVRATCGGVLVLTEVLGVTLVVRNVSVAVTSDFVIRVWN